MAGVDLGKQVGPLPLGAWVVVVAGGLGIALYTRRQSSVPTEIGVDTSGDAGVGTGAVGGFVPTSPDPVVAPVATPTTNEQWGVMVSNGLIAKNYPPTTVDSMVRKYLAGITSTMSPAEFALLSVALAQFGSPPQVLPPDDSPPATTPPPTTTPAPTARWTMAWVPVRVTGSYVGMTLGALQDKYAHDAAALGATKLTSAVLALYRQQAAVRNAMLTTTKLRNGQLVSIRKAVPA